MAEKKRLKEKRKEQQRKIRRDLIIEVAEKSFIENGFDDAKVEQIAEDAGYTKATLYNYFDSKDDLFAAVLAKTYQRMLEKIESQLKEDSYDIMTMGEAYLSYVNMYPHQAEFLDSGRCVTINRVIIEKEQRGEQLTESEVDFRERETGLARFMADVIMHATKLSGVENEEKALRIVKSLAALNPIIRDVVRRGKAFGQSDDEIRETLSVLFRIIEQGVKHYDG